MPACRVGVRTRLASGCIRFPGVGGKVRVARPRARAPSGRLVRAGREATRSRAMPVQLVEVRSLRRSCHWAGPDGMAAYDKASRRFATRPPSGRSGHPIARWLLDKWTTTGKRMHSLRPEITSSLVRVRSPSSTGDLYTGRVHHQSFSFASRPMLRPLCGMFVAISILQSVSTAPAGDAAPASERIDVAPSDWPWWRGPNRDGIALADRQPPLSWSETQNVIWKAAVPGRGHGSATVVGDQVILATADEQREIQSVLGFDRRTGKQLWKTDVHAGGFTKNENKKSSQASVTIACDGERLFVNFQNAGAIYATCLGRDGTPRWQKKISGFVSHQGFGASPAIYKSLVIFSTDNKGGGAIAALDRVTGETVWRHERPKLPNYTSPVIVKANGREQLIFVGCDLVSSFEPLTGKKLWESPGATTECVTSTVTDGRIVVTSGGYPKDHVSAMLADG